MYVHFNLKLIEHGAASVVIFKSIGLSETMTVQMLCTWFYMVCIHEDHGYNGTHYGSL